MSRPEKPIDWDLVDELLMAGCPGTEIAPHFDMHYETFYDRVAAKYGVGFTEYSRQKRTKGLNQLRKAQHDKALKGDSTMLIWLGKNYLDQRDRDLSKEVDEVKADLNRLCAGLQKEREQHVVEQQKDRSSSQENEAPH